MKFSLRAKFLLLSAFVQAVVVALLIGNSLRLMSNAVSRNADRVAHEYAVNLNLTLTPYASSGRLGELRSYWSEMLSDPRDSFLRYIVILDAAGETVLEAGARPDFMPEALRQAQLGGGVRTAVDGKLLHAQAPLLLQDNQVGMLHFGLSTVDLVSARDDVLHQGGLIALLGFALALLLFYAMTRGVGKRLGALARHSATLAQGQFSQLPESGGDELEVVTHSLNLMSAALRERIAQLEESQRRLRESEERFRTLFDMTPLPLSVSDLEGRIIGANQALVRTFGTPLAELIGRRSDEVTFWASADERQRIWHEFRLHGVVRGEMAAVLLPNGAPGQVAIWSSSLLLDGRHAIIWALLDLTQEMQAKQQLRELNDALESRVRERSAALEQANRDLSHALETLQRTQHDLIASEKMASLGSLVAGIAHELNTPIGNSLLASTALDERVKEFKQSVADGTVRRSTLNHHLEEVQLACGLISSSLEKAASLIASFKQIAVDQTNDQRRRFSLHSVAFDTAATYAPRLRRSAISMEVDVPPELLLDSYPGSLYQTFNNLINNALMHAFEGRNSGHLWLSARAAEMGNIEIAFRDNGAGMTDEVKRHIFDPFFTTKMGNGGTGLGMNIVYNIVTGVMGGRIIIDSAPGQGTTIRMIVPLRSPQRV
ncbi:ATP-binding protein [Pseudoduganella sp. HUAS MS19]